MRAQILFIEPADFCIVHLIDFGERERITTQEIFKLPDNLRNIQAQAKNVALSGIKIKDKCAMMSCDKDWIWNFLFIIKEFNIHYANLILNLF